MIAAVYDAPPLPERETVPARLLRSEWEEAEPFFRFSRDTLRRISSRFRNSCTNTPNGGGRR